MCRRHTIKDDRARMLKTSKKRSMDIAEGIYNRSLNIDSHRPARRSLFLAYSATDIRSVVDLGSRCCINIYGYLCEPHPATAYGGADSRVSRHCFFTKIVSSKNISFEKLSRVEQKHQLWKKLIAVAKFINHPPSFSVM